MAYFQQALPDLAQQHDELTDETLDSVRGGIIAVLIGLLTTKPGEGGLRKGITDGTSNTLFVG